MFCKIKKLFFCVFVSFSIFLIACSFSCSENSSNQISVMNWNLETFFDGEFDGNEYKEFRNAKAGWSKEKYDERLNRLAKIIKQFDSDIIVMEELEKEGQLFDITNRLSGTFDSSKLYKYHYFASEKGASIGCGVLSRFPIVDAKLHSIDVRTNEKQPSMRPIIQLTIKNDKNEFDLFVNHWKSKSGGAEKSEIWRDYQEKLLSRLIKECKEQKKAVLACGDFNRSIEEFEYKKNGEYNIVLKDGTEVYSPWFSENGDLSEIGSYFYKENWEYIDNFFSSNVKLSNFKVQNQGDWVDEKGLPKRYKVYTGFGYSDHLPITCTLEF